MTKVISKDIVYVVIKLFCLINKTENNITRKQIEFTFKIFYL
jgi:hypothetical protein